MIFRAILSADVQNPIDRAVWYMILNFDLDIPIIILAVLWDL